MIVMIVEGGREGMNAPSLDNEGREGEEDEPENN